MLVSASHDATNGTASPSSASLVLGQPSVQFTKKCVLVCTDLSHDHLGGVSCLGK